MHNAPGPMLQLVKMNFNGSPDNFQGHLPGRETRYTPKTLNRCNVRGTRVAEMREYGKIES